MKTSTEQCREPELVGVTREFGGGLSWVEVQLTEVGQGTTLELRHEAPIDDHWKQFGPGAVGVEWDLSLLGLGLHLDTGEGRDPEKFEAWMLSGGGKEFVRAASDGWGRAAAAGGEERDLALASAERSRAFYTGEAIPEQPDGGAGAG